MALGTKHILLRNGRVACRGRLIWLGPFDRIEAFEDWAIERFYGESPEGCCEKCAQATWSLIAGQPDWQHGPAEEEVVAPDRRCLHPPAAAATTAGRRNGLRNRRSQVRILPHLGQTRTGHKSVRRVDERVGASCAMRFDPSSRISTAGH
jgi:hypothetical protein